MLDFTQVPYVDSAGIGALVGAYVTHQKDGRSLYLIGVNERVQNALKVTRVEQFFNFVSSVSAVRSDQRIDHRPDHEASAASAVTAPRLSLSACLHDCSPFLLALSTASFAGITDDVRQSLSRNNSFRGRVRVGSYRAHQGVTPDYLEALSWMARANLQSHQLDRAETYAKQTESPQPATAC